MSSSEGFEPMGPYITYGDDGPSFVRRCSKCRRCAKPSRPGRRRESVAKCLGTFRQSSREFCTVHDRWLSHCESTDMYDEIKRLESALAEAKREANGLRAEVTGLKDNERALTAKYKEYFQRAEQAERDLADLKARAAMDTEVIEAAEQFCTPREYQNVKACRDDQDRLADNLEAAIEKRRLGREG